MLFQLLGEFAPVESSRIEVVTSRPGPRIIPSLTRWMTQSSEKMTFPSYQQRIRAGDVDALFPAPSAKGRHRPATRR